NQLLPKLFVLMHLPLKAVMISYSLSSILIYYFTFIFLFYKWKDKSSAWMLVLTFLVSSFHFFFWPCSELQLGFAALVFFRAFLRRYPNMLNTKFMIINFVFAVVLNLFHPLLLFPFVFLIGMEWLNRKHWQNIYRALAFVPAVLVFLLRYKIFPPDAYEAARMISASKAIYSLQNFFSLPVTLQFESEQSVLLWRMFFALSVSLIFLLIGKKFLQSAWLLICWIGILFFVHTAFPLGESYFSMASYYMPLSFISVLVLSDELQINFRKWLAPIILLIIFLSFNYDLFAGRWMYVKRQKNIMSLTNELRQTGNTKWIIDNETSATKNFYWTWAMGTESLLLSSLKLPVQTVTVYIQTPNSPVPDGLNKNSFIEMPYAPIIETSTFNNKYFHLQNQEYKKLDNKIFEGIPIEN
ncbi:MAG: hypothetical protein WCI97_05520, partial [Bacteroidota bacterium]